MKPKVSVIIPHWNRTPELGELLKRCVKSLPEVYEVIVVVNDGLGMGWAINRGFELASGDYLMTLSNDVEWKSGTIEEMCNPQSICIPDNLPGQWKLPRCFYCIPRWIYEKVGGYDEQFRVGYYEDDDLIHRWRLAGVPIIMTAVQGEHIPGQTLDKLSNRQILMDENREKFFSKWGALPDALGKG